MFLQSIIYRLLAAVLLLSLVFGQCPPSLQAQSNRPTMTNVSGSGWAYQVGSPTNDLALDLVVSVDGIAYVAGVTDGLIGEKSYGADDAWFAAIGDEGMPLWVHQIGTPAIDGASAMALGNDQQIYIAGTTEGQLGDQTFGGSDAWLAAYTLDGEQLWLHQVGNAGDDRIEGLAFANGMLFVAGSQTASGQDDKDGWIAAFDDQGKELWSEILQTAGDDHAFDVEIGSEQLMYVAGITEGQLGATHYGMTDGWLAAYTMDGEQKWLEQIGNTGNDGVHSLAVDQYGNVYLAGSSAYSDDHKLTAAPIGGWLVGYTANKGNLYDAQGRTFWLQDRDETLGETMTGMVIGKGDTLYVTGAATDFFGTGFGAQTKTWYAAFDLAGQQLWVETYNIGSSTLATQLTSDSSGRLYMTGTTKGTVRGENKGSFDAWIARLGPSTSQTLAIPHYVDSAMAVGEEKIIFHVGAVAEGAHRLAWLSPTGNKATALLPNLVTNTSYSPLVSPDGELIVTGVNRENHTATEVTVFDLEGDVVKTFDLPGNMVIPQSWSTDGKSILFAIFNGTYYADIYKVDYESGQSTNLTQDDAQSLFASWSPDGTQIAYMSDYQLWLMQADGTGKRRFIEQQARNLAWSPDGRYIAFESAPSGAYEDFDIWLVAADGTGLRNLSATPKWVESAPVWSPDSKQIVYTSGYGDLYIADLTSGDIHQLTQEKGDHEALAWLPSQPTTPSSAVVAPQNKQPLRKLAFTQDNNLYTIYEDGSGLLNLTNRAQAEMQAIPYAWSEDGRQIAYALDGNVYLVDVETQAQQKISSGLDPLLIDWHGTLLAVLRRTSDPSATDTKLRLSYLTDTSPWSLTDLSTELSVPGMGMGADPRLAWSPDGQWLAYSYGPVGGVIGINGEQVTDRLGFHPAWQQQQARLVNLGQTWLATSPNSGIWLFDPTTQQNRQLFEVEAQYVAYSPDDRYIAYADPYLKRMTSAGGDQTLLTEDRALTPVWSPSGDALAYVRWVPGEIGPWPVPDGLFIINADGTNRHQVVAGRVQNPTWQPQLDGADSIQAPLAVAGSTTPVTNTNPLTSPTPALQSSAVISSSQAVGSNQTAPAVTVNTPSASTTNAATSDSTGYVTAEKLNVRAEPSTQAAILQQLSEGAAVTIIGQSSDGRWLQIDLTAGKQGWVAAQYVQFTAAGAAPATPASKQPIRYCDVPTDSRVQALWQQAQVGCPTARATLTWAGWQPFEHGFMIWREDQKTIYHFTDRQSWQVWPDRWSGTPSTNVHGAPPSGLQAPIRGFGAIWEKEETVFATLGWATDDEKGFCLLVQLFEQGVLLKTITDNSCANGLYNHGQEPGFPFQSVKMLNAGTWNK